MTIVMTLVIVECRCEPGGPLIFAWMDSQVLIHQVEVVKVVQLVNLVRLVMMVRMVKAIRFLRKLYHFALLSLLHQSCLNPVREELHV